MGMRGLGTRTVLYQQSVAASLGLYNNDFYLSTFCMKRPRHCRRAVKTNRADNRRRHLFNRPTRKNGFVRRQPDPHDRRKVIIVPLYENKEDVSATYLQLHEAMVKLASSYSDEELELITQFLNKASRVLEEQIHHLNSNTKR